MTHFSFKCPSCGQHLETPQDILGQTVECPSCHSQITLAKPSSDPKPVRVVSMSPPQGQPPEPSRPTAPPTLPSQPGPNVGPKGVGGWLMFFCVGLTILGPLFSLGQMASGWEEAKPAFDRLASLRTAIYWENFGTTLILIYGFVVGCIIWGGNESGKRLAKQYLLTRLFGFLGIELVTFLLMLGLPSQVVAAALGGIVGAVFREAIYFLFWWLYFKKSKRVRNTYGESQGRQSRRPYSLKAADGLQTAGHA